MSECLRSCTRIAACLLAASVSLFAQAAEPAFRSPGVLRGGDRNQAYAVSADGSVVVGVSEMRLRGGSFEDFGFVWTPGARVRSLGTLGGAYSEASGISSDGLVIVGGAQNTNGYQRAFRWTDGTMIDLSANVNESSFALGVSGDGNVVVGWVTDLLGQEQPFRWTAQNGIQQLGTFGGLRGFATDANHDGSVVVGYARNAQQTHRAFRWAASSGLVDLGDLGGEWSEANAVTPDGNIIVGQSERAGFGAHAFRWTTNGMTDLGALPGAQFSEALDISADGSRIVGMSDTSDDTRAAVIWVDGDGPIDLNVSFRRLMPRGWHLDSADAISADGRFVVGTARNRRGDDRAFRLDLHAIPAFAR